MRLRNKIGQMLIMGFAGCDVEEDSAVVQWLQRDGLGGVLLFDYDVARHCYGKNLKSRDQIKRLIGQLKDVASMSDSGKSGLLPFIAVDYEGGAVDRFTQIDGCPLTMHARDQAALSDDALQQEALKMAQTLSDLGFNLNFAPVVDLNLNEQEGIIGKLGRSFSADPAVVCRAAKQFVNAFRHFGITCAYKHFPGHGSAVGDTHQGFVDVSAHYHPNELLPYTTLLQDSLVPAMVMTAHVINRHLDDTNMPASLSHQMITHVLREELGYDGVVVSDDLQMRAISDHYSLAESLCLTINAGVDMLIFANQLGNMTATEVIDNIEAQVLNGNIEHARIEQAYQRIVRLKKQTSLGSVDIWGRESKIGLF